VIKLTIDTRAVTTFIDVDHGLSLIQAQKPTTPYVLGDLMLFDSMAVFTDPDPDLDLDVTQVIATIPNPKPIGRVRRWCRRAVAWAVRTVRTARDAAAWVTTAGAGVAARAGDWWRRYRSDYAGSHRARVTWYGRERSTAEFVAQYRSATRRESASAPEGDLSELLDLPRDIAFVGWFAACVEVMRNEQVVLHEPGRHHFICS
jgi:hypothetical protein